MNRTRLLLFSVSLACAAGTARAASQACAYPAIANGRLYIHDFGTLWCYDVREARAAP